MAVIVVGLNHRTVPLEMLERMTVSEARLPKALHDLRSRTNLAEVLLLSTCNRTEVYAVADRYHAAMGDVRNFLAELSFSAPEDFSDHLYAYHDASAVAHLFKVASGLDSAVVGESEILGQVRGAWELAAGEGATGQELDRLFRHAIEAGKRARTETAIARGTTSVSQAAVAMAADRLGGLDNRTILVVGAGDMGEGMAKALARQPGVAGVLVANRTRHRAVDLAAEIGGRPIDFSEIPAALHEVDVVLASTGAPGVIVEADDLATVVAGRTDRPLLVVDVAVPRDVDPAVGELPYVTLLDMDDIRSFADARLAERRREVAAVEAIIDDEAERYERATSVLDVAPIIAALRARAEEIRAMELERHRSRLGDLDPRQREAVESLTRGIVNKLLHDPTIRMREEAGSARGERLAEALRNLFDV